MGLVASVRLLKLCQLIAGCLFFYLASLNFIQGEYNAALMFFSGCCVIVNLLKCSPTKPALRTSFLTYIIFTFYSLATLSLLLGGDQSSVLHLSAYLAYPFLAFSLLAFKQALTFVLIFALSANLALMVQLDGLVRVTYLCFFWGNVFLTSLNSFTYFRHQENLEHKLNRDPKTLLFNQQQFYLDLHKEQERAKREDTHLGLIYIQSDEVFNLKLAQALSAQLASYEQSYSLEPHLLVTLIPLAKAENLLARCEELRQSLPELTFTPQLSKSNLTLNTFSLGPNL